MAAVLLQACGGGSTSSSTVASITLSPTSGSVSVNGVETFTATALDSNGQTVTGQTFTWASSNTAIATITSAGVATGLKRWQFADHRLHSEELPALQLRLP